MAASSMQAGRLIRERFGSDLELFIIDLFLLGVLSVPLTTAGLIFILSRGHPTQFLHSDPRVGFHPGPAFRGTLNIIWVCMSTIFTCVYISVHSDVPDESKAQTFSDSMKIADKSTRSPRVLRAFGTIWRVISKPVPKRVLWMLFNVFAPELVVFVAVLELMSARDGARFMREHNQIPWSTKLAFFADMGGFEWEEAGEGNKRRHFRTGLEFLEWFRDTRKDLRLANKVLDADFLEQEIDDKCKANMVLKVFTLLQASWLLVETIIRLAEGRAVSELEVTTCAYIFCTMIAYCCWLHKPYNVGRRVLIRESTFKRVALSAPPSPAYRHVSLHDPTVTVAPMGHLLAFHRDHTQYRQVPDLQVPKLPATIYDGARFSPFNRSYRNPSLAWPRECYDILVLEKY